MGIYDDVLDALKTLQYFCSQTHCEKGMCPIWESCERNLRFSVEDVAWDMQKDMQESIRKGIGKRSDAL